MAPERAPDAFFTDALSGVDGTGDPAPTRWHEEPFADPLVVLLPRVAADPATVAAVPNRAAASAPSPESWDRDLGLPAAPAPYAAAPYTPARPQQSRPARRGSPAPGRVRPGPAGPAARPASTLVAPRALVRYPPAAAPPMASWTPPAASPPSFLQQRRAPAAPPTTVPVARQLGAASARGVQPAAAAKKKSGGFLAWLVILLVLMFATGVGRQVMDALVNLFRQ